MAVGAAGQVPVMPEYPNRVRNMFGSRSATDGNIRKFLKERFFIRPTIQIRGLGKGNAASLSELRIPVRQVVFASVYMYD
jgi:hypothetical protein